MPGTVDNALKCDQMVDFVRIHHKLEDIPYILVDVGVYNMLVCTICWCVQYVGVYNTQRAHLFCDIYRISDYMSC